MSRGKTFYQIMWEAALALLGIIGTIIAYIIKRRSAPTLEQRKDDVKLEFTDTLANVHRLRSQGNHAEADAMLRRLNIIASPLVRDEQTRTEHSDNDKR